MKNNIILEGFTLKINPAPIMHKAGEEQKTQLYLPVSL